MHINFKDWLFAEESPLLAPNQADMINLGKKRDSHLSGFCSHNPQINTFAKENSTHMFIVFAFVLYTIQKEWQIVHHTFADFIKWVFEEAVPTGDWNYANTSFNQYANLLGASRKKSPSRAVYLEQLWGKRNTTYANIMSMMKDSSHTSLSDSSDYRIFKYIIENINGLGIIKSAFACQLIIGKFGCLDSVNVRAYSGMIQNDIREKGRKSGFSMNKDNVINVKTSDVGLSGYVNFLNALEELYQDNVSKILWDDWCQIVSQKIVKAGKGKITLNVNNQIFNINPYAPKRNLADLLDREKNFLGSVDPEVTGSGVSLGHLSAIKNAGIFRTDRIKQMEHIVEFIDLNKADISNIEINRTGHGYYHSWHYNNEEYNVFFNKIENFQLPTTSKKNAWFFSGATKDLPITIKANGYGVDFIGPNGFNATELEDGNSIAIYTKLMLVIRKLLETKNIDYLQFSGTTGKMDRIYDKLIKTFANNIFTWYDHKILLNNSFLDRILLLHPEKEKDIIQKLSDTQKNRKERMLSIKKQEDDTRKWRRNYLYGATTSK